MFKLWPVATDAPPKAPVTHQKAKSAECMTCESVQEMDGGAHAW
jgi:hypothetical protein